MLALGVIKKADAAVKAGLLRRVTNVIIPYGDFKKHINVLLKCKWQSQWDEAVDNKLHEIHPLFDYVDFIESSNRHFDVNIFEELFENPPDSI